MRMAYKRMLKVASPYLKQGRPADYQHTKFLLNLAPGIVRKEKLDESIIIPALIFHDAGWGLLPKNLLQNYHSVLARRAHMRAGAKLAKRLLRELKYPSRKIKRIAHLVAVHDYQSSGLNKTLSAPDELVLAGIDFLWRATKNGFKSDLRESLRSPREQLKYLRVLALERRMDCFKFLYKTLKRLLADRSKELQKKSR